MAPAYFYLFVAVALIGTELLIMQFSVFWFLFFGLGALVASIASWAFPELSWFASTAIFLGASLSAAGLLYPKLKEWQDQPSPISGNDAIGQSATVTEAISATNIGKVVWSGTDWPAQVDDSNESFEVGESVTIRKIEGIRLIVGR